MLHFRSVFALKKYSGDTYHLKGYVLAPFVRFYEQCILVDKIVEVARINGTVFSCITIIWFFVSELTRPLISN